MITVIRKGLNITRKQFDNIDNAIEYIIKNIVVKNSYVPSYQIYDGEKVIGEILSPEGLELFINNLKKEEQQAKEEKTEQPAKEEKAYHDTDIVNTTIIKNVYRVDDTLL